MAGPKMFVGPFFLFCMQDLAHIESLITPVIAEEGLILWDVAWHAEDGRKILRVMVERAESAVSLGDCSRVSHAIEDLLEVRGQIAVSYHLEVSSPGLDRPLRKPGHFAKVVGKKITLRTRDPLEGRRNFKGFLKEVGVTNLKIQVDQLEFSIPLDQIQRAQLVID